MIRFGCTPDAEQLINRQIVQRGATGPAPGLRLAQHPVRPSLEMSVVSGPQPGDVAVAGKEARVYLDHYALSRVQEHVLDSRQSSAVGQAFVLVPAAELRQRDTDTARRLREYLAGLD